VIERRAKLAGGDGTLEVGVGRGDDARVARPRGCRADGLDLAGIEGAQKHRLDVVGELADLVEEQGAAGGALEEPATRLARAGERALVVAEQLGGRDRRRDRREVDRD